MSSVRSLTDQEEYDLALGGAWIAFARLHGSIALFAARSDETLYDYDEWTNRSSSRICDLVDGSHKKRGAHVLPANIVSAFRQAIEDRDAIAHSMVASTADDAASKLWRLKRGEDGEFVRDQVLTADWLDEFRRRCRDLRKEVKHAERAVLGVKQAEELERPSEASDQ